MVYATPDDLVARFGAAELLERTDLHGTGEFDAVTVGRALDDSAALIDGYLASRYPLPLAQVPALLVALCCDLARYALCADAAPDLVKDRRNDAIGQLRDIAAGRVRLAVGQPEAAAPAGLAAVVRPGRKVFGGGVG